MHNLFTLLPNYSGFPGRFDGGGCGGWVGGGGGGGLDGETIGEIHMCEKQFS